MDNNKEKVDLSIKRLVDKDEFKFDLKKPLKSDILPDISKRLLFLILGKVGSSKSTTLMNLLYNPNFYESQFTMKYYIAPTIYQDSTLYPAREDEDAVLIDEMSDEVINEIVKNQTIMKGQGVDSVPFSALIIEDALADKNGVSNNNSAISRLATNYRHKMLNIFIVSQAVNQISSVIRANVRVIILKKLGSNKELEKFIDNYSSMLGGEKYFLRMYNFVFSKPENRFDFLYINMDKGEVYHNFDKLLYKDEKEYI
tara:strand:+ start:411 stop:1178 length:768 start_codon:yes stop_codon:yes gene_type:complete